MMLGHLNSCLATSWFYMKAASKSARRSAPDTAENMERISQSLFLMQAKHTFCSPAFEYRYQKSMQWSRSTDRAAAFTAAHAVPY